MRLKARQRSHRVTLHPTYGDYANQILSQRQALAKEERAEQRAIEKEKRKPPTEGQAKAEGFATRMAEAERILTPLESVQNISTANAGERTLDALPFGNYLTSSDYQSYKQAAENWVRANLRRESGAVIGEEEMAREITTYFPQPGDSPQVIEQKRKARRIAAEAVAKSAKPGFELPEVEDKPMLSDDGWSIREIK
ncbi:MAG: hypothetical protein CMM94_00965 [Rickettsiales bacterium]|nr:hypothetical protein [Rickettsiales bacterium]